MSLDKLLSGIDGVQIELNKDLTKLTTMKLDASGDLIIVKSKRALKSV